MSYNEIENDKLIDGADLQARILLADRVERGIL
jgi:hypothetical protein